MGIAVLELDRKRGSWAETLEGKPAKAAAKLLEACEAQAVEVIESGGLPSWAKALGLPAGRLGVAALNRIVAAGNGLLGGHYRDEAASIAHAADVGVGAVIAANLAYDLAHVGCSTFVEPTPQGPLHARSLDWEFPGGLLRRHTTVVRVENGKRGPYTLVTWPGLFGALTGVAPGRFSISINYVRNEHSGGTTGLLQRAIGGCWPAAWLVRRAFDEAKDFESAVKLLRSQPLISSVLFTVAGTKNDERAVIERSSDDAHVRREETRVTNHYVSARFADENIDGYEEVLDTTKRLAHLRRKRAAITTHPAALRLLSSRPLLFDITQHQVVMSPRTGALTVSVPGGETITV